MIRRSGSLRLNRFITIQLISILFETNLLFAFWCRALIILSELNQEEEEEEEEGDEEEDEEEGDEEEGDEEDEEKKKW